MNPTAAQAANQATITAWNSFSQESKWLRDENQYLLRLLYAIARTNGGEIHASNMAFAAPRPGTFTIETMEDQANMRMLVRAVDLEEP